MPIRDLGYRAYEGELRAPSRNLWVMMRHGMGRIWGSWLNKFVVFFCWIPLLVFVLCAGARYFAVGPELPEIPENVTGISRWFMSPPAVWLRTITGVQFWFFAAIVTIRSGAGVISEDLTNKAYQFYFAKPLTPIQYLAGRVGALAVFVFGLVFVPTAILALKQGVGRLIRHRADRGIIAILDPRLTTARYGALFMASLPPARRTSDLDELARWWVAIEGATGETAKPSNRVP